MITSTQNKRVARAVRLKKRAMRERDRRFLLEGVQGIVEALSSGASVEEIFTTLSGEPLDEVTRLAAKAAVPIRPVNGEVMGHLTSTVTPQGVVAVAEFVDVPLSDVEGGGCVPVLVEVRDPGNAGTILRSADAAGAEAVIFTTSSVDVYNPKTVRATAGSLFHVPVVREHALEEVVETLSGRGYAVFAADAGGRAAIDEVDLTGPTAVMFGNEARGLSAEARALADDTLRIPIRGRAESLNLAAAATLVMFASARRRPDDLVAHVVAGAAHDIRSPLTALKGFSSTLLSRWERLTDEQRLMMVRGIVQDAARMELIVAQLVDAARMASRRLDLRMEPTDLLELARKVVQGMAPVGAAEVEVSGEPVRATVDPARLRTILLALIEGAQWWGDSGPVRVRVAADPVPAVTVSRECSDLDAVAVEAMFAPRPPGTGGGSKVGLFVARGLVEAHGGTLEVDADHPVTFRATLPPALPAGARVPRIG
jgi:RNA methyltransferase, TrmH family